MIQPEVKAEKERKKEREERKAESFDIQKYKTFKLDSGQHVTSGIG